MKVYRGQIIDTSEYLDGEVWTIALMNKEEQQEYDDRSTYQDDFAFWHTGGDYADNDIDYYANENDLCDGVIKSSDYTFVVLENLL